MPIFNQETNHPPHHQPGHGEHSNDRVCIHSHFMEQDTPPSHLATACQLSARVLPTKFSRPSKKSCRSEGRSLLPLCIGEHPSTSLSSPLRPQKATLEKEALATVPSAFCHKRGSLQGDSLKIGLTETKNEIANSWILARPNIPCKAVTHLQNSSP